MECFSHRNFDPKKEQYIFPTANHYKLRLELPLGMKAKDFYDRASRGDICEMLEEADVGLDEIIEIDDGLKPYYFYYWSWSTIIPVMLFDRTQVQKGNHDG